MAEPRTGYAVICDYETEDLEAFRSDYIQQGRREEGFRIRSVQVNGDRLTANFDMVNPYASASDRGGFHLSIFTAQEVCVELAIFWMHQRLGLSRKSGEAWMRDCSCRIRQPVRAVADVRVAMTSERFRVIRGVAYQWVSCQISDGSGGLFLLEQRGGLQQGSGHDA